MKRFLDLIGKHVDFHLALALIAILGTAGSLYLEFSQASSEFEVLDASMYQIVRSQDADSHETLLDEEEMNQLEKELEGMDLD